MNLIWGCVGCGDSRTGTFSGVFRIAKKSGETGESGVGEWEFGVNWRKVV